MNKVRTYVEATSNLAIIVVALLLGGALITRYLSYPSPMPTQPSSEIKRGTQLPLSKIDWSRSEKSLVMVLSTTCKYCTESSDFYKRLTENTPALSRLRTIAVFPQKVGESAAFLKERSIQVSLILEAEPSEFSVRGTPTLLLVNNDGTVLDSWVGKLSVEKEQEVMTRMLADVVTDKQ